MSRRFTNFILGLVTSLTLALPALAQDGWERTSPYNAYYNPKHVVHLSGTLVNVDRNFVPIAGMAPGLAVEMKTDQGQDVLVEVGPVWFTNHYHDSWNLQPGDRMEVTGSEVTINGKLVVMASQGRKGDLQLTVRKHDGAPLWDTAFRGF